MLLGYVKITYNYDWFIVLGGSCDILLNGFFIIFELVLKIIILFSGIWRIF